MIDVCMQVNKSMATEHYGQIYSWKYSGGIFLFKKTDV